MYRPVKKEEKKKKKWNFVTRLPDSFLTAAKKKKKEELNVIRVRSDCINYYRSISLASFSKTCGRFKNENTTMYRTPYIQAAVVHFEQKYDEDSCTTKVCN